MEQKHSDYWMLTCLGLKDYQKKPLPLAKNWLSQQSYLESQSLETELLTVFNNSQDTSLNQAKAGLCLRCYVSLHSLTACKSIKARNPHLDFRELLFKVLDDEGKTLIYLDSNNNISFIDQSGNQLSNQYLPFSIEILKTYDINKRESQQKSLKNWVHLKIPQNQNVQSFLLENNISIRTNWGMLNKLSSRKMAQLALEEQKIINVYHSVYRRDRRNSNQQRSKCLEPNLQQLQEMIELLNKKGLSIKQPEDLLNKLKEIAKTLRESDISKNALSLDSLIEDKINFDIPDESLSVETLESNTSIQAIREQFEQLLSQTIEAVIQEKIKKLRKKDKDKIFIDGLLLYYQESYSLNNIATTVGITKDQAKRLFKPAELIKLVRAKTVSLLCDFLIELGDKQASISQNFDHLSYLNLQVEEYLDQQVFDAALTEIKAGKNRSFDSLYAKKLVAYLNSLT